MNNWDFIGDSMGRINWDFIGYLMGRIKWGYLNGDQQHSTIKYGDIIGLVVNGDFSLTDLTNLNMIYLYLYRLYNYTYIYIYIYIHTVNRGKDQSIIKYLMATMNLYIYTVSYCIHHAPGRCVQLDSVTRSFCFKQCQSAHGCLVTSGDPLVLPLGFTMGNMGNMLGFDLHK